MEENVYFECREAELAWLKRRDKRLGAVIDQVGQVRREVIPDFFMAVVHSIVGQQISSKAHATVWRRICEAVNPLTPQRVAGMPDEALRRCGISYRKAAYIKSAAQRICSGEFDVQAVAAAPDEEAIRQLCTLDGIGRWSAEMLLLFSLQRRDVLSFGDFGIRRGLRMVYGHREIDERLFERYRRRYSPCGSVASLYLWAVAGGAVEGLTDKAATKKRVPARPAAPAKKRNGDGAARRL